MMKIRKKIQDWATGNYINFKQENDVYEQIITKIQAIMNYLDVYVQNISLQKEQITEGTLLEKIDTLKANIEFQKIRLKKSTQKEEQQKIYQELQKLQQEWEELIIQIKNDLLQNAYLLEIQKNVYEMNGLIYQNAFLETLQPFLEKDMINKKWNVNQLNDLRNSLAQKRMKILPYLIEMEDIRKK